MATTLSMVRGKTAVFYLTVTKYDGTTQSLAGSTLRFQATVLGVSIDKSSPASGITITDAPGGLATLQIEPADTAGLPDRSPASSVFIGPFELTLINGSETYMLASGNLSISGN